MSGGGRERIALEYADRVLLNANRILALEADTALPFDEWCHRGDALNAAGWAFLEEYRRVVGEPADARLINNVKGVLRAAISEYAKATRESGVRNG